VRETSMFLVILYLVISTLAEACNSGEASAKCDGTNCEMVGTAQICINCETDNVPINGKCTAKADAQEKCTDASGAAASKVCAKCAGKTFMFKSGCYETTNAIGKTICTEAADGKCTAAAPGYFLNPLRANNKDSVVACSNTTGFTETSKTYNGVQYCEACDGSALTDTQGGTAKCTKCSAGKYLKVTDSNTQCLDSANNCGTGYAGKEDNENGNKCLACTDQSNGGAANCETCEYNTAASKIKCTKCTDSNYLKTAADGTTTCETNCGDGYFQHIATTGSLKTCQLCAAGTTTAPVVSGIQNCASCTYADSTLKCTACGSGYKLEGETCVSASTNKSGLSTGAIAGISVAAVVVVGGLVGFLCWWFVCRGKA
ncbi:Variant-specific surface protein, partial [Giardia duodenalis]